MIRLVLLLLWALPGAEAYTISGTVVHGTTGVPLGKAHVFLAPAEGGTPPLTVTTGSDGAFRFEGLKAGKYGLSAERLGFVRQAYMQRALYQQYSTAVVVGENETADHLVFRMIPGAAISGVVRDTQAEPVPQLTVQAYRVVGSGNQRHAQMLGKAATDDRGYFRLPFLAAGSYVLAFGPSAWRYADAMQAEELSYPVTFYPSASDSGKADLIHLKAGEEARADLMIAPLPAVRVEGVVEPEDPAVRRIVSVRARGPFGSEFYVGESLYATGTFTFEHVPAGDYLFTLWEGTTKLLAYQTVKLAAPTTRVTLGEVPSAKVSVKVDMLGVPRNPGIHPRVTLNRDEGGWLAARTLGEDGLCEFAAVPAGRYQVLVYQGRELAIVSLAARGAQLSAGFVDIPESGSVELTVAVDSNATDLNGRVFRGDRPEAGVLVMLAPRTGWENPGPIRFDQSDSDGTFAFRGVSEGDFLLFAFDEGEPYDYIDPEVIRALLPTAQPVRVTGLPGQTVRLVIPAK
ncbi:MAG: carboxypeptidase-like regulatory domain-containing protein [Bryobacteraceae bacterium]|jgi:hypothetical protein